jgi:hypothetical protein
MIFESGRPRFLKLSINGIESLTLKERFDVAVEVFESAGFEIFFDLGIHPFGEIAEFFSGHPILKFRVTLGNAPRVKEQKDLPAVFDPGAFTACRSLEPLIDGAARFFCGEYRSHEQNLAELPSRFTTI